MGKTSQYRNWAITWNSQIYGITPTDRDGHLISYGGYSYVIYVGPEEDSDNTSKYNHHHCLVHCESASVSKTKAKEVLQEYTKLSDEQIEQCVTYIQRLDTTLKQYLSYCWKGEFSSSSSREDDVVKQTITDLKLAGNIPTHNRVKRKLIEDHGADAYNRKYAKITDIYINDTDIIDNRGNPKVERDQEDNMSNFITSLFIWRANLNGAKIFSGCSFLKDCTDLSPIVFMISLLPYFTKRLLNASDKLPSLYLFGRQGSGKSSMFNNCRYVKKVATDAVGVSRYKMSSYHSALLFDDIENSVIEDTTNSSTIKQLCLGDTASVKVFGETQDISAFIIITSNEKPNFCNFDENDDVNVKVIKNSWKRRFITCLLSDVCPMELESINFADYQLRDIAAMFFKKEYEMMEQAGINSDVLKYLKVYYNVAVNDYYNNTTDEEMFIKCYNKAVIKYKSLCKDISDCDDKIKDKYYKLSMHNNVFYGY